MGWFGLDRLFGGGSKGAAPAAEAVVPAAPLQPLDPKIGKAGDNGRVYAGISPKTGEGLLLDTRDYQVPSSLKSASDFAAGKGGRVPSVLEVQHNILKLLERGALVNVFGEEAENKGKLVFEAPALNKAYAAIGVVEGKEALCIVTAKGTVDKATPGFPATLRAVFAQPAGAEAVAPATTTAVRPAVRVPVPSTTAPVGQEEPAPPAR